MATIKIHGVPPSPFTRTVLMAAHEKGIDCELVMAFPGQLGPLNRFEKVPVMSHGDFTLFESTAIMRYLDRAFPGPKLWPDDLRGAALCDQWASAICDSFVNSALRYIVSRLKLLPVPKEMEDKYFEQTRAVMAKLDARLGESAYLAGDTMTAADLLMFPILDYFGHIPELGPVLDASPNCKRWLGKMDARASAKATVPQMRPPLAA